MKNISAIRLLALASILLALFIMFTHFTRRVQPAGYVGGIEAVYSVDANGNGNYSIALNLPPGTAKINPALSFNYSTIQQNGLMGVGWKLLGLSEITRVPATLAQDGFFGYLQYDTTDRYALDGERLTLVAGSYGGDSAVFHTQVESWSRIVGYNQCGKGFCTFKVWMKNGLVKEYNAVVNAPGTASVRTWALSRMSDRNGNYMTIDYVTDARNSALYPQTITYTMNAGISQYRYVKFNYEPRPDSVPSFQGGYPVVYNKRLTGVQTFLGGQPVMTYSIQYQQGITTGKSQVRTITQSDGAGSSLSPTTLAWQGQDTSLYNTPHSATQTSVPDDGLNLPMDVNGDGLIDYVHAWQSTGSKPNQLSLAIYISNGTGFNSPILQNTNLSTFSNFMPLRSMDVNGDGWIDLVYAAQSSSSKLQYTVLLSNGQSFVQQTTVTTTIPCNATPNNLVPLDVNGDGKSDLVMPSQSQQNYLQLQLLLSNGTGFNILPVDTTHIPTYTAYPNLVPSHINDDPLEDLVYAYSSGSTQLKLVPLISNGAKYLTNQPQLTTTAAQDQYAHLMPADMNGDQLSDLVISWTSGSTVKMGVFYSNGKNYAESPNTYQQPSFPIQRATIIPMEINGDQKVDFMYSYADQSGNNQLTPYISNGWTFTQKADLPATGISWSQFGMVPIDINGDAKSDLLNLANVSNPSQSILAYMIAAQPYPDLVNTIQNGIGGKVSIQYKALTDPTVYTRQPVSGTVLGGTNVVNRIGGAAYPTGNAGQSGNGTYGASFPIVDEILPVYVVSDYVQFDGNGNQYPYNFHYSGAKIDLSGYGWLGYASKSMTDPSVNLKAVTNYYQLFPLTTKVQSTTQQRLSDGAMMSRLRLNYSQTPVVPGNSYLQQVLLTQTRADNYTYGVFNNTIGNNFKYDNYGNITLLTELNDTAQTSNIAYTIQQYQYNPADWQLGLMTDKKVATDSLGRNFLTWEQYTINSSNWEIQRDQRWVQGTAWTGQNYTYDAYGNRTNVIDDNNDTTTLVYDTPYRTYPVTIIQPPNKQGIRLAYQYTYDPRFGTLAAKTDANGNKTATVYDGIGNVIATLGPNPSGVMDTLTTTVRVAQTAGYYVQTDVKTNWNADTTQWVRNYQDGIERTYQIISEGPTPGSEKVTIRNLDSKGRVIRESVPFFNGTANSAIFWTTTVYDPYGRVTRTVMPKGNNDSTVTVINYPNTNTVSSLQAAGTADSARTTLTYQYYKSQKQIASSTDGTGKTTSYQYDILGQVIRSTDPLQLHTTIRYNGLGQRTFFSDTTLGPVTYQYNLAQRTTLQSYANGKWQLNQFDALWRILNKISSDGDTVRYTYDDPKVRNGLGQLTTVDMPGHNAYQHSYDAYGNIATILLQLNGQTYTSRQTYTPNHLPDQMIYPDGSVLQYGFTTDGILAYMDLDDAADGQIGNFQRLVNYQNFTARGEPQKIQFGNNTTELFNWYVNGMVSRHQLQLSDQSLAINDSLTWNYRSLLQSVKSAINNRYNQAYVYDDANRLLGAQTAGKRLKYRYDPGGNLIENTSRNFNYTNYQLRNVVSGNDTLVKTAYDAVGSVIMKQQKDTTYHYSYDAYFNLDTVAVNGKPVYNFLYDNNNNRLQKTNLANNSSTIYVSPNYLITIAANGTATHTKYLIGPTGMVASVETPGTVASRLITSQQKKALEGMQKSTGFWIKGTSLPLEVPPGGWQMLAWTLLIGLNLAFLWLFVRQYYRRYLTMATWRDWASSCFWAKLPKMEWAVPVMFAAITFAASGCSTGANPVFRTTKLSSSPSTTTYFHQNFNNSTTVSTTSSGAVGSMLVYLPFGDVAQVTASDDVRFKFSNKELDDNSNLYYFNSRYYDSSLCRFISADSQIGGDLNQPDIFNRYAYVLNSPLNYTDPSGHGIFSWFASLFIDILEIAAGVAVTALSEGSLSIVGEALIGAGINGGIYSATHFNNFSWKDWGVQDAIGAAMGLAFAGLGAVTDAIGNAIKGGADAAEMTAGDVGESASGRLCTREVGANEDMEFAEFQMDGSEAVNAQCFTAGTLVATDHGSKKIETIAVGDAVWSYDENTGQTTLHQVVRLFQNEKTDLHAIEIDGVVVQATAEHPFYRACGGWTKAADLRVGDLIQTLEGKTARVDAVQRLEGQFTVYNFEVEQAHTYFVSTAAILVHNVCYTPKGNPYDVEVEISKTRWPESAQHIEDAQANGQPEVLTIDRSGARANRSDSLRGIPTKSGFDRDEYPPAMFAEGGTGASVRYISPWDNRSSGSYFGNFLRWTNDGGIWPNGTRVWFHVVP